MKEMNQTSERPNQISYEKLQKHLADLEIKRNRINASLNVQKTKQKRTNSDRNLRTRTMIQMGGLIRLSGLMSICDITEGDDLQNDLLDMDKAATLLGILVTCVENMRTDITQDHMAHFRDKGIRALKMSPYYREKKGF